MRTILLILTICSLCLAGYKTDSLWVMKYFKSNVAFIGKVYDSLTPEMFGAVGDGVTDDAAAIQAAINASNKFVYLSKSIYLIKSTVSIRNKYGFHFKGTGYNTTQIKWDGDDGDTMLVQRGCIFSKISDVWLNGNRHGTADTHGAGICLSLPGWLSGTDTYTSTRNEISEVRMGDCRSDTNSVCLKLGDTIGTQMDGLVVRRCFLANSYKLCDIMGNVTFDINFQNCTFSVYDEVAEGGIANAVGVDVRWRCSMIQFNGCQFVGGSVRCPSVAFIRRDNISGQVNVTGCQGEMYGPLFYGSSDVGFSNQWPVSFKDNLIGYAATLDTGVNIIEYYQHGTVSIEGGNFNAPAGKNAHLKFAGTGTVGVVGGLVRIMGVRLREITTIVSGAAQIQHFDTLGNISNGNGSFTMSVNGAGYMSNQLEIGGLLQMQNNKAINMRKNDNNGVEILNMPTTDTLDIGRTIPYGAKFYGNAGTLRGGYDKNGMFAFTNAIVGSANPGDAPAGMVQTIKGNALDSNLNRTLNLVAGGGGARTQFCSMTATGVAGTAKTIATPEFASLVFVSGNDGGSNFFFDLIIASNESEPIPLASYSHKGTPAARTYSRSSTNLQLLMASGTYTTNSFWIQLSGR